MNKQLEYTPYFFNRVTKDIETRKAISDFVATYRKLLEIKQADAERYNSYLDINNLTNEVAIEVIEITLAYIDPAYNTTSIINNNSDYISSLYSLIDTTDNSISIDNLLDVKSITDTLHNENIFLLRGTDYVVDSSINKITFLAGNPFVVDSRLPYIQTDILNPNTNDTVTVTLSVLFGNKVTISEDWYYKRIGVLLGLPEFTAPGIVMSLYRLHTEGMSYSGLDAFIQACNGYPVTLKNETVTNIEDNTIYTDLSVYSIPSGAEIIVSKGEYLKCGSPLIRTMTVIDHVQDPDWWLGNGSTIPKLDRLPEEVYTFPNINEKTSIKLGILNPSDSGDVYNANTSYFWVGFPTIKMLLFNYYYGDPSNSVSGDSITSVSVTPVPITENWFWDNYYTITIDTELTEIASITSDALFIKIDQGGETYYHRILEITIGTGKTTLNVVRPADSFTPWGNLTTGAITYKIYETFDQYSSEEQSTYGANPIDILMNEIYKYHILQIRADVAYIDYSKINFSLLEKVWPLWTLLYFQYYTETEDINTNVKGTAEIEESHTYGRDYSNDNEVESTYHNIAEFGLMDSYYFDDDRIRVGTLETPDDMDDNTMHSNTEIILYSATGLNKNAFPGSTTIEITPSVFYSDFEFITELGNNTSRWELTFYATSDTLKIVKATSANSIEIFFNAVSQGTSQLEAAIDITNTKLRIMSKKKDLGGGSWDRDIFINPGTASLLSILNIGYTVKFTKCTFKNTEVTDLENNYIYYGARAQN